MGKLQVLKDMVAKMFETATEKENIEQYAKLNNAIAEVETEQKSLEDKNAELIKDYKDLVKHTSFRVEGNKVGENDPRSTGSGSLPSVEEALKAFMAEQQKK